MVARHKVAAVRIAILLRGYGKFIPPVKRDFQGGKRSLQFDRGLLDDLRPLGRFLLQVGRDLFEQLPFVVVGSVDGSGQPWTSMLAGYPGFMAASADLLTVSALPVAVDPLVVRPGASLGLLGIEPHTRRRNRMNGLVESVDSQGFSVRVQQSFGNCPKYI